MSNGVDELTLLPSGGAAPPACDSSCIALRFRPQYIHTCGILAVSLEPVCPNQIPTLKSPCACLPHDFHPRYDHVESPSCDFTVCFAQTLAFFNISLSLLLVVLENCAGCHPVHEHIYIYIYYIICVSSLAFFYSGSNRFQGW